MAPLANDPASLLFRRFAERGDPDALTRLFDLAGPELLALASHLSPGGIAAEDLVQDCFLAAIRKARRWNPKRPVLPWLAGMLIREAQSQRRRMARGLDGDRLALPQAPSGEREAMGAELRQSVELALAELPPRYREVVAASLMDGEDSAAIAARLARAPGTVRVQLHRGLDLLRRALPPGIGFGLFALPNVPRGMADIRRIVQSEAALRGPALAAAGGTLALPSTGLISMSIKSYAIAALAVVAIGAGVSRWGAPDAVEPLSVEVAQADAAAPNELRELPALPGEARDPAVRSAAAAPVSRSEPKAEPKAPPHSGVFLRGTVEAKVLPEPTEFALQVDLGMPDEDAIELTLRGPGPFEVDLSPLLSENDPARLEVLAIVRAPGFQTASAWATLEETEAEGLILYRADLRPLALSRTLRGRLVHPDLQPLERAWVGFLPDRQDLPVADRPVHTQRPGSTGSFELQLTHKLPGSLFFTAQGQGVGRQRIESDSDAIVDLGDLELIPGATIAGRASRDGKPVPPGSTVLAILPYAGTPRSVESRSLVAAKTPALPGVHFGHRSVEATIGEGGRFELKGLTGGATYRLLTLPSEREGGLSNLYRGEASGAAVAAPATGIELDWGLRRLRLRVRSQGSPVARAKLWRSQAPGDPQALRSNPLSGGGWDIPAACDAAGELEFHVALGDKAHLRVEAVGYTPHPFVIHPAILPEDFLVDVDLTPAAPAASLRIELDGTEPAGLEDLRAFLYLFGENKGLDRLGPIPVQSGAAVFDNLPPATQGATLALSLPQSKPFADLPYADLAGASLDLEPFVPGEQQTCRVTLTDGGRIELHLTDRNPGQQPLFHLVAPSGEDWPADLFAPNPGGHGRPSAITTDGPYYLQSSLAAGTYGIRQVGAGYAQDQVEAVVTPGETTVITFGLRAP